MPSPFPGVDPYLEGEEWDDFHTDFIVQTRRALVPLIRPRYVARVEKWIYLERAPGEWRASQRPDLAVIRQERSAGIPAAARSALADRPVKVLLPIPREEEQSLVEIRMRETGDLVTVVELLSPGNKRSKSDGQKEYVRKRETLLRSSVNLVEMDLLRGGERMPIAAPLTPADFCVISSRPEDRPEADAWSFSLRQHLPTIKVPLDRDDADVGLDLQAIFDAVYDEAGYDYSLDYDGGTAPPLSEEDAAWARDLVAEWRAKQPVRQPA